MIFSTIIALFNFLGFEGKMTVRKNNKKVCCLKTSDRFD
jgi:hypothetical protein